MIYGLSFCNLFKTLSMYKQYVASMVDIRIRLRMWSTVEMKTDSKNEIPRVKPVTVTLYPLQIPHELC
jgi:hypothetical protein